MRDAAPHTRRKDGSGVKVLRLLAMTPAAQQVCKALALPKEHCALPPPALLWVWRGPAVLRSTTRTAKQNALTKADRDVRQTEILRAEISHAAILQEEPMWTVSLTCNHSPENRRHSVGSPSDLTTPEDRRSRCGQHN